MSGPEELRPQQRLAWLLLIGRRLKQEYDAIAKPLPAPLDLLLQRLEARVTQVDPVGAARQDASVQPGRTEATPLVRPSHGNTSKRDDSG
jgi:hypothetical protein